MVKKQSIIALILTVFIASAFFTNTSNASIETSQTLISTGSIIQENTVSTAILRDFTLTAVNPNQNIKQYVDNYVGNYTFADNMIVMLSDLGIEGILQYPKQFNQTSGKWPTSTGWSWNQLETLIDSFHSHGWKVWWSGTAIAWNNQWLYNYLTKQHPELTFTDANGYKANNINGGQPNGDISGNKSVAMNQVIPDFWANYSTPDNALGIANNTRLLDVITMKFGQMITKGLQFDGWSGADGWNGFNIQGYNFQGSNAEKYYSFSYQEEMEWATDTSSGLGLPTIGQPISWTSWNITEKAQWIVNNSTASSLWYEWWCYRFADMYLQIKNCIMNNNPTPQKYYTAIGADSSSQWSSGNLGGGGLLNFTMIANNGAIDLFDVDPETTYSTPNYLAMPKVDAYVAALVKAKDVRLIPGIGIQGTSFSDGSCAVPEWNLKQQYLSQVQNYVWYNGIRYPACDRSVIFLQYVPEQIPGNIEWATNSWNNTAVHQFFNWIAKVNSLLTASPQYLGPTKVNGYYLWGGDAINGLNYTFAQWVDQNNLEQNIANINPLMGTLFLEQSDFYNSQLPRPFQDTIFSMFEDKQLNLIVSNARGTGNGGGPISSIFNGGNESLVATTLHLSYSSSGVNQAASVLNKSAINDPLAMWIAGSNNLANTWTTNTNPHYAYCYNSSTGFMPIALSTDNRVALGIYYNASTANFLYMCLYSQGFTGLPAFGTTIPRDIINRAISWNSNSAINSSSAMVDCKVFQAQNGDILIPMINQDMTGKPISTTLDLSGLGFGLPINYSVNWASSGNINVTDWSNIDITLSDGADVLIISSAH